MGGALSTVMMARNSWSVTDHEGAQSYIKRAKPVVREGPRTEATASGSFIAATSDHATMQQYQDSVYNNGTMLARFRSTCTQYGSRNAVGVRPVDRIEQTTIADGKKTKKWEYIHYKPTVIYTYSRLWETIENFGRGLIEAGVTQGTSVGMYEDTRMEWLVSCYGIWCAGGVGVTVYANLGEDALVYAMKEAELSYMFCNGKLVKNLIKLCTASNIPIPTLIYTDDLPADLDLKGATVFSFNDLVEKGRTSKAKLFDAHTADDLGLIMYTSGTTGDPKGVMMSQGNLISAVTLLDRRFNMFFTSSEQITYLAYLPLAHILEFAAENVVFLKGSFVGYGSPRTLTDIAAKPHGDLAEFRPHFLCGVPRVYDTIRKGVEALIPAGVKRRVYDDAFATRLGYLHEGKDTPYFNEKVFNAVKAKLGGRCQVILSGGAPLSAKVQEFMHIVCNCTVIQGYGLTETCACTTTQLPWDLGTDEVGCVLDGIEVKLRDAEEWKHTDQPEPRGEVLVRGPMVTKGYYKQPAMTKESFLEGGWFATGDVGAIDKNGNLRVIGRVKALVKNAFGEYVALDSLEAIYSLHPVALPNGVCVLVNGQKSFICALVVTDESKTMAFAREHNLDGQWPEILKSKPFQDKINATFADVAKKNKRKAFEVVKKVVVLADEWTPENGILTAAQKLKRREIDKRYADLITELFATEPES